MSGSLISVALSLGLPRPGVTRHRCLVESGLSSRSARSSSPLREGVVTMVWGMRQSTARGAQVEFEYLGQDEGQAIPCVEAASPKA